MKVYTKNSRSLEQTNRMKLAEKKNICPFCKEGLAIIHKQPTIKTTADFFLTKNAFPYEGTSCHYLIIPKKHLTTITDLTNELWPQIGELFNWILTTDTITNGGMFLRFGNVNETGSSVSHLHFQIISGSKSDTDVGAIGLKVKLGYK